MERPGERHSPAHLLDDGAQAIREAFWRGARASTVSVAYNTTRSVVDSIIARRIFAHLPRTASEPRIEDLPSARQARNSQIKAEAALMAWNTRRANAAARKAA